MSETAAARPSAPGPREQIGAIIHGYWQSRALAVAAELELADFLADGPLSLDALAAQSKTDSSGLFRLLRALESIGIFKQVSRRVFANTAVSECLLKNVPGSQWASVRLNLSTGLAYEAWAGLTGSIQTNRAAFDQVHGCGFWEFLRRNPDKSAIFKEAMHSITVAMTPAVTAAYDWSRFPVIADIGGGIGTQLVSILDAYPNCRGILFDEPHVVADAIPHERVQRMSGDVFAGVPAGADAYVLRGVIHDWGETEAFTILRNVRKAMFSSSRLIVIEALIPETPDPSFSKWTDLTMLALLGGRERTAAEYRELYATAGFEVEEIIPTPSRLSIIIGRPRLGD